MCNVNNGMFINQHYPVISPPPVTVWVYIAELGVSTLTITVNGNTPQWPMMHSVIFIILVGPLLARGAL